LWRTQIWNLNPSSSFKNMCCILLIFHNLNRNICMFNCSISSHRSMKIQGCCIYSLNTYLTFIFSYKQIIQYAQCCMSTESQFLLLILQLNMHIFLFKLWNINKIQHIFLKLELGFKFQICVRHNYLYVSFSVDLHWCLICMFNCSISSKNWDSVDMQHCAYCILCL
jgi:hypothetical protein